MDLTVGELAKATGVATSALRYWEDLGVLAAPVRVSGQRRYPSSAVAVVGLVVMLQDIGFTLREVREFLASRPGDPAAWRALYKRKLGELDERIAQAQAARVAIEHGLNCKHEDILGCPTFAEVLTARLSGASFREAHNH